MIVYQSILNHRKTVYVTEMSSKMAQTLSKKWQTIFRQKAQNFVYFEPLNFVQISTVGGPNTYQIMYAENLDLQRQRHQWEHKMPDRKISFCSKFAILYN